MEASLSKAWEEGNEEDFLTYLKSILEHQFKLSYFPAKEAAKLFLESRRLSDAKSKETTLFKFHEVLSKHAEIQFDTHVATKILLEMETGKATTGEFCRYASIVYGGISGKKLAPAIELRNSTYERYYAVKENPDSTMREHHLAWMDLTSGLTEYYARFNEALKFFRQSHPTS